MNKVKHLLLTGKYNNQKLAFTLLKSTIGDDNKAWRELLKFAAQEIFKRQENKNHSQPPILRHIQLEFRFKFPFLAKEFQVDRFHIDTELIMVTFIPADVGSEKHQHFLIVL